MGHGGNERAKRGIGGRTNSTFLFIAQPTADPLLLSHINVKNSRLGTTRLHTARLVINLERK